MSRWGQTPVVSIELNQICSKEMRVSKNQGPLATGWGVCDFLFAMSNFRTQSDATPLNRPCAGQFEPVWA